LPPERENPLKEEKKEKKQKKKKQKKKNKKRSLYEGGFVGWEWLWRWGQIQEA
jgi:hypothetical protein